MNPAYLPLALALALFTGLAQADPAARLDLIGHAALPLDQPFDGAPIVGISGLARLGDTDRYLGISDDTADSLFYLLDITVPTDGVSPVAIEVVERRRFQNPADESGLFAPDSLDPEGIAYDPQTDTLLWASESRGGTNSPVFVHAATLDGAFLREIPVDAKYDHRIGQGADGTLTQGIFSSAGFESLTLTPSGDALFMAPEDTLVQDGPPAKAGNGATGLARILRYERTGDSWAPAQEFAYEVSAREDTAAGEGANSLVDLLAVDGDTLLALEREWPDTPGAAPPSRNIKIFQLELAGATDVIAMPRLDSDDFTPVSKRLVLDFDAVRDADNGVDGVLSHEAMVFGPTLDDGRQTLVMLSDNDGNRDHQLLVFAVTMD